MANLIYKIPQQGCYVTWSTSSATSPQSYYYGSTANYKCMYADLEPNTTYTIQRIDDSEFFRVATTRRDLMVMSATSESHVSSPFTTGRRIDSSSTYTFTTGNNDVYLVVYYTSIGEDNVRVMLNEGARILPYEEPAKLSRYSMLEDPDVNFGYPYVESIPGMLSTQIIAPYPEYCMKSGGDYPVVNQLPALKSTDMRPLFNDYMMRCLGEEFNSGYPVIMPLENIVRERLSDIYFCEALVTDMFFEEIPIQYACCGGKKVFGIKYHQLC